MKNAPSIAFHPPVFDAVGAPSAATQPGLGTAVRVLEKIRRNLAATDLLILTLDCYLCIRVLLSPPSAARATACLISSALLAGAVAGILICRGEFITHRRWRAGVVRIFALTCFVASYFEMRYVLMALDCTLLDSVLLSIDEAVLGVTPAVFFERWLSPATTQWFSFYYYSYMWLLALNLAGSAIFDRNPRRLVEILVGGAMITTVGHFLYTIVPGIGPFGHLVFQQPLPTVFWWSRVQEVVGHAGAVYDIFPSLHTAFPTFFALHAIRHRRCQPFKALWPVALFFSVNIILSTMFLRWHYAVDVVAGLVLSRVAQVVGIRVADREQFRELDGRQPSFESIER